MNMEDSKDIQEIKLKVKKYLELENVSVLAGAGTSFHLGAPIIRTLPYSFVDVFFNILPFIKGISALLKNILLGIFIMPTLFVTP